MRTLVVVLGGFGLSLAVTVLIGVGIGYIIRIGMEDR